jgi:2-oxoisovalerate dehydrogenase E1 component
MAAKKTIVKDIDWGAVARIMLASRAIDEIEENELVKAGKVTYQFSAKGHELAQALLGLALDHPHDAATVYYRSRPLMLAAGLTAREAFAADMARAGSPSEGRDVGVVYSLPPRGGPTVLPASGDVGAQYTPAAGWAQAITYYQRELKDKQWDGALAVALGGDGSVASNGFWAALTIAATLELPMLFFIEDNRVGISVSGELQTPGANIAENLASFKNLYIRDGDGTDPEDAATKIHEGVEHIRSGKGPALVHLNVVRLHGHTYGEDQTAYKSPALIEAEFARDPMKRLQSYLGDEFGWEELAKSVEQDIRAQLAEAEASPDPDAAEYAKHLFYSAAPQVPPPDGSLPEAAFGPPQSDGARINLSEAVRRTLTTELAANPKLVVFGEDVGLRGGVHRVTVDLQAQFGEARVFDTSLSEEGIIGRSVGLALAGLRPAPEIQFRKYADPATEQINDLGWLRWRTAGKFGAPVVVRIPVGYSKKTGDPWHSVSGEAVYAHTLGWRIAYPSNAEDAAGLLRTALREHDPTLFLEHRALYDTPQGRMPWPGDDYCLPFGQARIVQEGNQLTVVSWGEMLHRCIEAAEPFAGEVELIDLRTIIPWDREAVLASVQKTGKCLVAHEDSRTVGFGAEIIAEIAEAAFTHLDGPVQRITTPDTPIPFNIPMMNAHVIPSVGAIRAKMRALIEF